MTFTKWCVYCWEPILSLLNISWSIYKDEWVVLFWKIKFWHNLQMFCIYCRCWWCFRIRRFVRRCSPLLWVLAGEWQWPFGAAQPHQEGRETPPPCTWYPAPALLAKPPACEGWLYISFMAMAGWSAREPPRAPEYCIGLVPFWLIGIYWRLESTRELMSGGSDPPPPAPPSALL